MSTIVAGTYEIQREIGSGGGGVVYLARHLRLEKPVVLKVDKRSISASAEKLRREIDALKNLSHTFIPQVYDFIVENDRAYTVIDYIDGESFDKPLARGETFPQPSVVKWTRQLLEALCYLHTSPPNGILHADIKPANIMLTKSGDICLIDFNIALALKEEGAVSVGRSFGYASPEHYGQDYSSSGTTTRHSSMKTTEKDAGTVFGSGATTVLVTQGENASESAQSGKRILLDVRSDIYSLGATLYHIITGKRPPKDAIEVEPISPAQFSPAFIAIINKAMSPDPQLRYQTAADMLAAINDLHNGDPRYKRHVRNRYIAGAILASLFLMSGFSTFTGLKRMEQTQSALTLAEYSANALAEGNTALAADYALRALPVKTDIFTPPPAAQAQKALADALGVYDLADGYKPSGSVELPSPPLKIAVFPNGRYAAAVYAYEIAIFEPETAQIISRLPTIKSALADAAFASGAVIVYAGEDVVCAYDIETQKALWQGKPATEVAISADGKTVAAVNKDSGEAVIYSIDGTEKKVISFEGKKQRVLANDTFGNPEDNLLALNRDGSLLAASFADGSLDLFDLSGGEVIAVETPSGFTHFEGGFSGDYFAFSAAGAGEKSVFVAVDTAEMVLTGSFESDNPFGVLANESGVYLSSENLVVKIDPNTGEQKEVAYTEKNVVSYSHGESDFIVATAENSFSLFGKATNLIEKYDTGYPCNFVEITGDFALAGGRDSPNIRILQRKDYSAADAFTYDHTYPHDEARVNSEGNRMMMFSYKSFRLYDMSGSMLCETAIPDAEMVYDQQYSKESGNLAVIYKDALRIYSGESGSLLFEKTGLQSAFYAPYGVSILENDGTVSLIAIDTANVISTAAATGNFAAICGMTVDSAFLGNRELIGASKTVDGYLFAVSDGATGAIYNDSGKELFSFTTNGKSEALFTGDIAVISPLHGTPSAYSIKTGKKIRDLEPDAYMTYVTKAGDYIVSEYVAADGTRFGTLLDSRCETVARLPFLTDVTGTQLLFDYKTGCIRQIRIHSLDELIQITKGGQ